MALRLPSLSSTSLPVGVDLRPALLALEPPREGYLQLTRPDRDVVVLFYAGAVFAAGCCSRGSFSGVALDDLAAEFADLDDVVAARVVVTDLALFLCNAVLFKKAPAAHVPAALVDSEAVLKSVAALGKDAVVVVSHGDARSLLFCRGGTPVKLYAASGEEFAADGSLADRVADYAYRHGDVSLDLYDDIRLQTAKALAPLSTYVTTTTQQQAPTKKKEEPAWLVVRLADRVVFRFPIVDKAVVVGRGEDVDLVLDNLSVSRSHARITRDGVALVVDDLESENGLVQRGERKARVVLQPGDEVDVGKYTLAYSAYAAALEAAPLWPRRPVSSSGVETVAVVKNTGISLEHDGKNVRVPGAVFVIGKGDNAHLKIDGWFVADHHVVLAQHGDGAWKATWSSGLRALRVNGKKTRQARLVDGDVLAVGSNVVVFRAPHITAAPRVQG